MSESLDKTVVDFTARIEQGDTRVHCSVEIDHADGCTVLFGSLGYEAEPVPEAAVDDEVVPAPEAR